MQLHATRIAARATAILVAAVMLAGQAVAQTDSKSRREIVDANTYPWSSIGKVGNGVGGQCTGVVISVNEFLTAAHCIYYPAIHRLLPADSIHLLLGYIRGEYRVHKIASKYVVAPSYDAPVEGKARPDDWVVLYVNDRFPPDIKPLTMADVIWPGMLVKAGGYARERRYMMTADQHCRIEALSPDGRLIRHSCLIEPGDSGGPVLRSSGGDEGVVIGINVAVPFVGANRAVARNEDFRGGIAVSAASIVAFLAASAPSREPQEGAH